MRPTNGFSPQTHAVAQREFLALLPRIQRHAKVVFRDIRRTHWKEELLAEAIALAWRWVLRLVERNKDVSAFPSALATFACRAARSGRRLYRQESVRDVLSRLAQRRSGFVVNPLPAPSTLTGNVYDEALQDNMQTPPDEQAIFRIDFPVWLASLSERKRRVAEDLMVGETTLAASRKHNISPGRISQLRREFHAGWERFCDPPCEDSAC
jgi:hypothetical protein